MSLEELLADWICNDTVLSKHFKISGKQIIDGCRYNNIRAPMGGIVYGEATSNNLYVRVVAAGSKPLHIVTLSASKPDFFNKLREILIHSHNEAGWCRIMVKP